MLFQHITFDFPSFFFYRPIGDNQNLVLHVTFLRFSLHLVGRIASPDQSSPKRVVRQTQTNWRLFTLTLPHRQPRFVVVTAITLVQRSDISASKRQDQLIIGQHGPACGNAEEALGGEQSFSALAVAQDHRRNNQQRKPRCFLVSARS